MEFYTGIHEPHVMEDVIDEEIVYGPVIHDVEDTENYQETMEVIEEETLLENISHDKSPLIDTCNDHHLVIAGQDFWIPNVPEQIKPEERVITHLAKQSKSYIIHTHVQQGLPNTAPVDTLDPRCKTRRRVDTRRCECNARIRVDNNTKQLNAMFWADETAKLNYKEFGDVVSFDATFRTNSVTSRCAAGVLAGWVCSSTMRSTAGVPGNEFLPHFQSRSSSSDVQRSDTVNTERIEQQHRFLIFLQMTSDLRTHKSATLHL
ncbi:hypothetical protein LXL04_007467 [Taraxacum kok-saghyz]